MWLLFFVYVFLIWAFPVHFAARAILRTDSWMIPSRLRDAVGDRGPRLRRGGERRARAHTARDRLLYQMDAARPRLAAVRRGLRRSLQIL